MLNRTESKYFTFYSQIMLLLLTLPMLRLNFHPEHNETKIYEKHLNPVMLVFIG